MNTNTGACPQCMAINSTSAVRCIECTVRLPWADEAERQLAAEAQVAKQAQQTPSAQKAPLSSPARPAKTPTLDDDDVEWWIIVGGGILVLVLTAFGYWRLAQWETTGGIHLMRGITALLYSLGGKWLVAGVGTFFGVIITAAGIVKYFQEKR